MKFRIALAQTEPRLFDKSANLEKAAHYIRLAASQGAAIVIFPELHLTGYTLGERAIEMAETPDGPCLSQISALARSQGIAVMMGYAELVEDGSGAYDALFFTDQTGRMVGSYRKTHLYRREKEWFVEGKETTVLDWGNHKIGPLICYELEFPEVSRLLALQGAHWLTISTNNMESRVQEVYLPVRASENRLWAALVNRVGREGEVEFIGESAVSDPFGRIVARAGRSETLLLAEIDLTLNARARIDSDYLADRKPHLYGSLARSVFLKSL